LEFASFAVVRETIVFFIVCIQHTPDFDLFPRNNLKKKLIIVTNT